MVGRCGICVGGFPVTLHGDGYLGCIRPHGHEGPHLVRNGQGHFHCWVPDDESDDPDDFVFWEVGEGEVVALTGGS